MQLCSRPFKAWQNLLNSLSFLDWRSAGTTIYLLRNTALCICSCFALVCWCTRLDLRLLKHVELTESLRWEKGHRAKMEGSYNESIRSAWLFEMALKVFKCLTLVKRKRLKDSGLLLFHSNLLQLNWFLSLFFFPLKWMYTLTFTGMVVMWRWRCRREVLASACQCCPWPKFITAH